MASPRPIPGHEVYGFVPYWEMDGSIAAHLRTTALTTLALFSVTTTADGAIATSASGYRQITGSLGKQLIREAHKRGVRVELVFTSFGYALNKRFFSDLERQDRTIGPAGPSYSRSPAGRQPSPRAAHVCRGSPPRETSTGRGHADRRQRSSRRITTIRYRSRATTENTAVATRAMRSEARRSCGIAPPSTGRKSNLVQNASIRDFVYR